MIRCRYLVTALIISALALAGCGERTRQATILSSKASGVGSYQSSTEDVTYGLTGMTSKPPPADMAPTVSPADAVRTCQSTAPCPTPTPDSIRFGIFNDSEYGQIQPDNSVKLSFVNVPAWILTWRNGPCGPGSPGGSTCENDVFVNAQTGAYMLGYAGTPTATAAP